MKFLQTVLMILIPMELFAIPDNESDSANVDKATTPSLSLEDCLLIGLEENLQLKNQRINVKQSELRKNIYNRALLFPDINTSGRLSSVYSEGDKPRIRQSIRAFTNFTIFDWEIGPRKRKLNNFILLNKYFRDAEAANLQREIAVAYIQANLVRKKQDIMLQQLLELDSLYELSLATEDVPDINKEAIFRLRNNIEPLQEAIQTQLKGLETNYDDRIGELNNLMSLDNSHNFRLADELKLSEIVVENENQFINRLIDQSIEVRSTDDNLRKQNLEEDMKIVNAVFFPDIDAGISYEQDFMTQFQGFSVNLLVNYNVYDPNARKRKDLARLDIESINNSILDNKRNIERVIRGNYNKSNEFRSQVRPSLVEAQRNLYLSNLEEFLGGKMITVSATDVVNSFRNYYEARHEYYENIASAEIHITNIRFYLMDFVSPFNELGTVPYTLK
ncbi:MAG: TolC family protein [Cyclobacteriaceae bacterium]